MAEIALDGFDLIGEIIKIIFLVLEIAPLAWLFLNFMNFWNICSFYLFLDADIPLYLKMILETIYEKINTSLLDFSYIGDRIYPLQ